MKPPGINQNADSPLEDFSGCHAGIIENLNRLRTLVDLVCEAPGSVDIKPIAKRLVEFFRDVVLKHHAEEEEELFTAVLSAAADDAQALNARKQIDRLVAEHRELEAMWRRIEPALKRLAKGKPAQLDLNLADALVQKYLRHAEFEEREFLPLSARLLSSNEMSALGLSLHMRHLTTAGNYYI